MNKKIASKLYKTKVTLKRIGYQEKLVNRITIFKVKSNRVKKSYITEITVNLGYSKFNE